METALPEQGAIAWVSRTERACCASSPWRREGGRQTVCEERERSLRHLRQVLKETEKAIGVQERASARLTASIERSRNGVGNPARLEQMTFVRRRLAFVLQAKREIEREIEGLKQAA